MVSVNAYGVDENITFPLMFKVFQPKGRLKENDTYQTKIELASSIITELVEFGFKIELVLADSLYGEASSFIRTLEKHELPWVLAIRSNHGVWLSSQEKVRANKWSTVPWILNPGLAVDRLPRCKFYHCILDDSSLVRNFSKSFFTTWFSSTHCYHESIFFLFT